MTRTSLAGAIMLALVACTGPQPAPAIDAETAIEATYQRYDEFIRHVNADSIASLYTPDGEMIGTGAQGPAAIAAFLRGFANIKVEAQSHTTDAITVADSLAVHWGRYRQRAVIGTQPPISVSGRFVIEWHLAPDGRWLVRRLMTVPDQPKA